MRLLVLSQYFWPENFRVNDLVSALAQRGHDITVLTGLPNYPDGHIFPEYRAAPERFSSYEGTQVVRVPLLPRGRGAVRLALNYLSFVVTASTLGAWRLRGRRFDAVFVYQPSPITSCLPALVIGRLKRAPVMMWTLDLWPEALSVMGVVRSPVLLRLVGWLVTFIYRRCEFVLGTSRAFEQNVTHYSGDSKRFRYFPQWSESLFGHHLETVEPAPEMRSFGETFKVLFAGNIGNAQDFPAILDAAERLRHRAEVRWLVVGDGRAADWVRGEIARRDLSIQVQLLGRHPIERMPAFFRGADALLVTLKRDPGIASMIPSIAATIPGKVQAYLTAGRPLIGMLDGEGARVIEESGAGFTCEAGDSIGLAAQVEKMASLSSSERAAMGARGIAYARREFDRDRLLAQLEEWLGQASSATLVRTGK